MTPCESFLCGKNGSLILKQLVLITFFIQKYKKYKSIYIYILPRNGAISTDLFVKPTDGHQYLHYRSSHPEHIKNSIPCSQALRLSRICSSEKDFKGHVDQMKEWFLARGHPENVVNEQINKVVLVRASLVKEF